MRASRALGFLTTGAAFCLATLWASPSVAQFSGQKARQRYDKSTKGASIDDYVRRLGSDEPDTRLEAVKSLGGAQDPKAIEYLIQAVGDPDVRIQAKAIDYLGDLRATEAVTILVQYLSRTTTDSNLKQRILAALGKIGDVRAAPAIADFLERDLETSTRGTAIFALGEISADESTALLKQISEKDEDATLRRLASEALAKLEYRQAATKREAKAPAEKFLKPDEPAPPQ